MTQRPFGIGCQPKGHIDCINSNRGETGYHSIAVYDRELTAAEIQAFELTPVVPPIEDRSVFEYLAPGKYAKIRHSVYDHFSKVEVINVVEDSCLLDWGGTKVWRHKDDFNSDPLLFCA